jgi:glycosyltransferase involved in cell wall biosynthesis
MNTPDFSMFNFNSKTKKKVLLRGPVLTQSGYGVHTRQVAKWLFSRQDLDVEVQALPWGDTPWLINTSHDDGFIGKIMEKTVDPSGRQYDATVQIQLPNEWDTSFSKVNIGVTAGVETDRCNPEWVHYCNRMSLIVVPSSHTKNCLVQSGNLTVNLQVIPESFSESLVKFEKTAVDDIELSTPFNFLLFGQLTGNNPENERKNIFYTVKWLCETFKNDKDVGIIIKTNSGRNTSIDRKIVTQTFETLMKEVRKGMYPRVYLLHGDMSDEEVSSLYRHPKVKALVSLTKGEGYGLPILEAAASALPVIATGWSGHIDFLSHGKFIDVNYSLNEIHPTRVDNKIFMKGSKWAIASEEDFKKKVLKFKSSSSIPKEWAKSLQEKILEKYSIEIVKSMYNEVTKDLI